MKKTSSFIKKDITICEKDVIICEKDITIRQKDMCQRYIGDISGVYTPLSYPRKGGHCRKLWPYFDEP